MGGLMWPIHLWLSEAFRLSTVPRWGSKGSHWGWWSTSPMSPIKCWQGWAQNKLPFLPIASGDTMATRPKKTKQKMGPPHHSWHALASTVKCLKAFTSVFFRVEITERALMWNMRLLSRFISSIPHPTSFSLVPPSLKDAVHGYGSECEALIMPWLCFKGLAPSYNFASVSRKNL